MISIVVCSINDHLFENFSNSVAQTIGTEYEIIRIDNTGNLYSIAKAYNLGAQKAQYDYLCFVHEDVLFKTSNWGLLLTEIFKGDRNAGIVGVAGSKYKSLSPSGWPTGLPHLDCYHLLQHFKKGDHELLQINNPDADHQLAEVKIVDGLFIFTKKDIWKLNPFDSETFQGFHCYDLDYSLQVGRTHKILVSYQILIEHFSEGMARKEWVKNAILLSKKWAKHLPQGDLPHPEKADLEWHQKKHFFLRMLAYGYSTREAVLVLFNFGFIRFFNLKGNLQLAYEIGKAIPRKILKRFKIAS